MDQEIIELLRRSREEITSLRRTNEVLAAKVEVMELFACVLHTQAAQSNRGMTLDIAWEIQRKLEQINSGVGTVEGIRAIMGTDMPVITGDAKNDIPWIKRLRDKTGCGLKEAKDAMEMILKHSNE